MFHPEPRREAFIILLPQSLSATSIQLSATAPLREPLHFMARHYVAGVRALRFQSIIILNALLKAACSDAQSPSLYPDRARQWLRLPG